GRGPPERGLPGTRPKRSGGSRSAGSCLRPMVGAGAGIAVDVLVNNAGIGMYGPFEEQDPHALDRMLQLNTATLTTLTRLALPGMRSRRWGRILNIASVVGYQPGGPRMAVYYATKAYVLSFSRGLAR